MRVAAVFTGVTTCALGFDPPGHVQRSGALTPRTAIWPNTGSRPAAPDPHSAWVHIGRYSTGLEYASARYGSKAPTAFMGIASEFYGAGSYGHFARLARFVMNGWEGAASCGERHR
jgi:hypothetical protein